MMLPWERREVLVTNSAEKYGRAQTALRDAGIRYSARFVNTGNRNRGTFIGRVGGRPDLEIFYYLYVRKTDVEKARHVISQAK